MAQTKDGDHTIGKNKPNEDQISEKARPEPTQEKLRVYKCKVHRMNVEKENMMLPITLNGNNAYSRHRKFFPNEEVILTETELDILRNSGQEDSIEVPLDSGIYQSRDPLKAAEAEFPGFKARHGRAGIVCERRVPNYIVEIFETFDIPASGYMGAAVGRAIVEGQDPDFLFTSRTADKMAAR